MMCKLSDIALFNPTETIKKGEMAKKVAMDKLISFCRDIPSYEITEFNGGTKFKNGDTIMARITPCLENGKTAKVNILEDGEIGFGSTEYIVFRAIEGIADEDYLYYLVCSPTIRDIAIKSMVGTSGRQRVQTDVVKNIEIDLPTLEVQKKIGGLLKSLDDKIALNNKINNNLLEQIRALCKSMVMEREDLKLSPISDHCITVTKGTTPTTLGKPFVIKGINFIKAESILDDHSFERSKFAFIDEETNHLLRRSIIQQGDIVYTIAGTLGRFALVDDSILPANTNQAVAIIRIDSHKMSPEYLYSLFIADWQNEYYTKHIQQAVQANLSLTTIKSLPIPILEGDEMEKYISLISPMISTMKSIEKENSFLSATRNELLPKLMSGEVDVSAIEI